MNASNPPTALSAATGLAALLDFGVALEVVELPVVVPVPVEVAVVVVAVLVVVAVAAGAVPLGDMTLSSTWIRPLLVSTLGLMTLASLK